MWSKLCTHHMFLVVHLFCYLGAQPYGVLLLYCIQAIKKWAENLVCAIFCTISVVKCWSNLLHDYRTNFPYSYLQLTVIPVHQNCWHLVVHGEYVKNITELITLNISIVNHVDFCKSTMFCTFLRLSFLLSLWRRKVVIVWVVVWFSYDCVRRKKWFRNNYN